MKGCRKFGLIVSTALITISFASCNTANNTNAGPDKSSLPGTPAPGSATTSNLNANMSPHSGPDNFWTKAALGGMAEVELGRLASNKAQNQEVKQFALMMAFDHSKAGAELKTLATKKNVPLPTALDSKHQSVMQQLQGLSGADFDRAYVAEMVKAHEADVQMFEKQSGDNSDAELKAFATSTLPTLRKHLEAIKGIQAKLK